MRILRCVGISLLGLIWSGNLTVAAEGPAPVGRWRSVEISTGGIGSTIEFRENGAMDFSAATAVSLPYRIEGDALVLPPATSKGPELRQTMAWISDSKLVLTQKTGDAQGETILVRATPASGESHSLLGEWTTQIKMPERTVSARYIFQKDKTLLLIVSFVTQRGVYRVAHLAARRERHMRLHFAGRGIEHWAETSASAHNVATGNEMA